MNPVASVGQSAETYTEQAVTDDLTGLANNRAFREQTIEPSELSVMHSIGAIEPSKASTTSAIEISAGLRASM